MHYTRVDMVFKIGLILVYFGRNCLIIQYLYEIYFIQSSVECNYANSGNYFSFDFY